MKADPILLACFFVFILFLFCNSRKKSFRSRFKKKYYYPKSPVPKSSRVFWKAF